MLLECAGVDTFYGDSQVLNGASLSVSEGEHLGVIGRNGMGKTTLVHTIMGMLTASAGEIRLDGKSIRGKSPEHIAAAGITLVPQGRRVFGSLTVGENLQVSYRPAGTDGWTVEQVCERLPILGERWRQPAGLLSGGQQQMLAVGRALVGNGRLVLMDEPSEGLDQHHLALVVSVVQELRSRGTAVLVVEQKLRFVLDMVDRLHVMTRGQFVQVVDSAAVRADPEVVMKDLGFSSSVA